MVDFTQVAKAAEAGLEAARKRFQQLESEYNAKQEAVSKVTCMFDHQRRKSLCCPECTISLDKKMYQGPPVFALGFTGSKSFKLPPQGETTHFFVMSVCHLEYFPCCPHRYSYFPAVFCPPVFHR
jgi:hypothetical protein